MLFLILMCVAHAQQRASLRIKYVPEPRHARRSSGVYEQHRSSSRTELGRSRVRAVSLHPVRRAAFVSADRVADACFVSRAHTYTNTHTRTGRVRSSPSCAFFRRRRSVEVRLSVRFDWITPARSFSRTVVVYSVYARVEFCTLTGWQQSYAEISEDTKRDYSRIQEVITNKPSYQSYET